MALTGSSAGRGQSDTQLIAFRGWTLRVRHATSQPSRLLLLIHGWTGDENSMWVFVRRLPASYSIVAPRAPYITQPGGYSWRPTAPEPGGPPTLKDLRQSAADLLTLVDAFAADNGIDARDFDAIGFSQGAALVNVLALLYPDRIGRFGILAGFLPAGAEDLIDGRPLDGKSVFVAHGRRDDRVNVEEARRSIGLLEQAGARVTYCEEEIGHKVSAGCLRALEAFFA